MDHVIFHKLTKKEVVDKKRLNNSSKYYKKIKGRNKKENISKSWLGLAEKTILKYNFFLIFLNFCSQDHLSIISRISGNPVQLRS